MNFLTLPNLNTVSTIDAVSNDTAALAEHMHSCANERSPFYTARVVLDAAHVLVCSRMVTVAILVGGSLALLGII